MTSTLNLIDALRGCTDLTLDNAMIELEPIMDALLTIDALTQLDADLMMTCAHAIDPTESHFAAELRDCIRDNFPTIEL